MLNIKSLDKALWKSFADFLPNFPEFVFTERRFFQEEGSRHFYSSDSCYKKAFCVDGVPFLYSLCSEYFTPTFMSESATLKTVQSYPSVSLLEVLNMPDVCISCAGVALEGLEDYNKLLTVFTLISKAKQSLSYPSSDVTSLVDFFIDYKQAFTKVNKHNWSFFPSSLLIKSMLDDLYAFKTRLPEEVLKAAPLKFAARHYLSNTAFKTDNGVYSTAVKTALSHAYEMWKYAAVDALPEVALDTLEKSSPFESMSEFISRASFECFDRFLLTSFAMDCVPKTAVFSPEDQTDFKTWVEKEAVESFKNLLTEHISMWKQQLHTFINLQSESDILGVWDFSESDLSLKEAMLSLYATNIFTAEGMIVLSFPKFFESVCTQKSFDFCVLGEKKDTDSQAVLETMASFLSFMPAPNALQTARLSLQKN